MFGCILLYMTIRNTFSVYKIFVLFKLHSIFLLFTINNNKSNIKFSTNIFSFFSLFVFFFSLWFCLHNQNIQTTQTQWHLARDRMAAMANAYHYDRIVYKNEWIDIRFERIFVRHMFVFVLQLGSHANYYAYHWMKNELKQKFIGKNKINEWNGEHQNIRTRTTDILPLQTERNARLKWKTNNAHTHNRDGKYIGLENFVFAQHFCNSILLHGFVIQYSVLTEVSCTLYANNNQSSMCLCVCRFQSGLAYIHTTIQI